MMHGSAWSAEALAGALGAGGGGGANLVLLDCRDSNQYNTSHVRGALHVTIPTIIMRRMRKTGLLTSPLASVLSCPDDKERLAKCKQCDMVVVYDQGGHGNDSDSKSVASVLLAKLVEEGYRACALKDGFETFSRLHPELCTDLGDDTSPLATTPTSILGLSTLTITDHDSHPAADPLPPTTTSVFPVEVLPYLFLGNCENSADMKCLYAHGIKHVVNVTQDCANHFEPQGEVNYLRIPIKDHWSENLFDFFHQAILFIEAARVREEGVLIHCLAGISRSVTITLAYLMHALNLDLNEAFDYVRRKRANISPNFNFMGQLQDFEKSLKSQRNCTCSCPKRNSFFAGAPAVTAGSVSPAVGEANDAASKEQVPAKEGLKCACSCHSLKSYFTSPGGSTNNSSGSSSFSVTSSGAASSPQFSYDVPASPT